MAKVSKKTRQLQKATAVYRVAYVREAGLCECCQTVEATDCHEIPAGSSRQRAIKLANTWLALCRDCHRDIQGSPFAEQFAMKVEAVRRDINRCLGRTEL
jgi:5-methylcytosine-specific restriction endonuclease McrA